MATPSRFSRRHLLALSTFLVPLAVLAVLGGSELQRSGTMAQTALTREARQFLVSARQTVERQLDQYVAAVLPRSEALLVEHDHVVAAMLLRDEEQFSAVRSIILVDDQATLVWPTLPQSPITLPFARDARASADNPTRAALDAAGLLLEQGRLEAAINLLQHVITEVETANPPSRVQRPEIEEIEMMARFRLATAYRRTGAVAQAVPLLERVQKLAGNRRPWQGDNNASALGFLAEATLAELGPQAQRVDLLREIATGHRDQADGLANAVALRLSATFAGEAPERPAVDALLRQVAQRAATRTFAANYEFVLKYGLRRHLQAASPDAPLPREQRLISTVAGEKPVLLSMRPATNEEAQLWKCTYVVLHLDLGQVLAPALLQLAAPDSTFVLAIDDPNDIAIVPPPTAVPADFEAPVLDTFGLTLRAFPADPARLVADAESAVHKRTLLLLALFVAALGGALWSWRSVSREAELAALKIDLVSRVSHELKTPLALIRMYGETLGMGRARDANQAAEFGGIIARESDRLTALIQRILDFSRQQAGTLQYSAHRHDLGQLLRAIVGAYAPHLESRGTLLIDELPLGIDVQCDANACESAVVNLLENAAKYGPEGEGEHEIELILRAERGQAVLEVRDHGRGIPAAERQRVFEGFYRASNSGEVRGAGLGLSLVRHFVQAHGGTIEALDNPGGGTIMRLSLPLTSATANATNNPVPSDVSRTNP